MGRKLQFKKGITSTNPEIKAGSYIETDGILAIVPDDIEYYWNGGGKIIYLNGDTVTLDKDAFERYIKLTASAGMIPDDRK